MATGSVRQRGKSWYIVYPYTDESGEYKRKWERAVALGFPNTRRGAEQALRSRLSEIDEGRRPVAGKITLGEYIESWHRGRHGQLRGSSLYNESARIRNMILPYLGDIPLSRLTRADIRAWQAALHRYKPRTIQLAHTTLVSVLHAAVDEGLIRENVASKVGAPRVEATSVVTWEIDDIRAFMTACEHYGGPGRMLLLIVMTGLRGGEARALRWADVNLKNGRLVVSRTVTVTSTGAETVGPPKTRNSHRAVQLSPTLVQELKAERERARFRVSGMGQEWSEEHLVYCRPDGRMYTKHDLSRALDKITKECNLPRITVHQLRHIHATWLMLLGTHPKVVSERLGHSRIGITLDLYSHVTPTMQHESALALEKSLDSNNGSNLIIDAQES